MKRTYGRRNSRRAQSVMQDTFPPPRKRSKIEVEIVKPKSSVSPSTSIPISHSSPPRAISPIRRNVTLPHVGSMSSTPSSIHTPTKPARNLTTLFPPSPCRTPGSPGMSLGVANRMLSRSRTESSIDRNTSHSLPFTPSSNITSINNSPQKGSPSCSPIPILNNPLPKKHVRTYAGASRSYRIVLPAADIAQPEDTRESYSDLRSRLGVDNSEDDPRLKRSRSMSSLELSNGMTNDLKSITELRSKGESRRFLDEVGYLFEGMEAGCAIALRRASVLEIITKLCDSDFNRRAKTSDFYTRTWDVFIKARGEGSDKVLDATLSFFAFFSTHDLQTLSELSHKPDFAPTLLDILRSVTPSSDLKSNGLDQGLRKDILALTFSGLDAAELRATGVIRTDVAPFQALADVIAKSGVVKDVRGLSIRTLLSTTLSSLPVYTLPPALPTLSLILDSLRAELRLLTPRVSAWEGGSTLFPGTTGAGIGTDGDAARNRKGEGRQKSSSDIVIPSISHIHACLRLFDAYLLEGCCSYMSSGTCEGREEIHRALVDGALLNDLVELCMATEILVRECVRDLDVVAMDGERGNVVEHDVEWGCDSELARKTLFSTLRILTLLPPSASFHSYDSISSSPCPTYSRTLWTPGNTALSLVTRMVLRAQAGWIGSLLSVRAYGEEEQLPENKHPRVKTEQIKDVDTSSLSPSSSPRQISRQSTQNKALFPVPSSPRSFSKRIASTPAKRFKIISEANALNEENDTNASSESTSHQGDNRGKRQKKARSDATYSLTSVESFDLLCLALGLLLNWTAGGGEAVGERIETVLLNPACPANRNCTYTCLCPPSLQLPLLSCLTSIYHTFRETDSSLREQDITFDHARESTSDVDQGLSSTVQMQTLPSANRRCASASFPKTVLPQLKCSPNTRSPSMPQFQSPEVTFLTGYTAVLLGLLYTSTPREMRAPPTSTNRPLVFGDVPLEALIFDTRNFLALYEDIEGELNNERSFMDIDGDLELGVGSNNNNMRLGQGEKGRGKALEKRNEDVAREVLEALESLWDEQL